MLSRGTLSFSHHMKSSIHSSQVPRPTTDESPNKQTNKQTNKQVCPATDPVSNRLFHSTAFRSPVFLGNSTRLDLTLVPQHASRRQRAGSSISPQKRSARRRSEEIGRAGARRASEAHNMRYVVAESRSTYSIGSCSASLLSGLGTISTAISSAFDTAAPQT